MSDHSGTVTAYDRLVRAIRNTDQTFSHQQMSWLMGFAHKVAYAAGVDAGYQARVAEENASYPAEPYGIADGNRIGSEQKAAREAAAADRSQRWAGGGKEAAAAQFMWGADRPDEDFGPSAARWHGAAGVPVRRIGAQLEWRDEA